MIAVSRLFFAGLAGFVLAGAAAYAATPLEKTPSVRLAGRAAGDYSLGIIGEYTTGDYGTGSDTNIWYFPVTLRYSTERYAFRLTVPYLSVDGTGNVVVTAVDQHAGQHAGQGAVTTVGRQTESGLGDVIVSGTYTAVPESATSPAVELTGKIKLATADENRNLGTGENDYAVEVELFKSRDQYTGFGGGGYKILGDPPGVNYNNVFYGFIGVESRLDKQLTGGIELYVEQAATSASSNLQQLTPYLAQKLDKTLTARGYLILGLSDGSPDWGIGVGVTYYWR
jgi:hypothetical protein